MDPNRRAQLTTLLIDARSFNEQTRPPINGVRPGWMARAWLWLLGLFGQHAW